MAIVADERPRIAQATKVIWVYRIVHIAAKAAAILLAAIGGYLTGVVNTGVPYAAFIGPGALAAATLLESWDPAAELALRTKARDTLKGHLDDAVLRVRSGAPIDRNEVVQRLREILADNQGLI
ncbi:MAG TPA: hypothetical protein VK524_21655 [Polyangiaceae bacterium]|nr:hypothetical protein [Polyangiaceae bacterium]